MSEATQTSGGVEERTFQTEVQQLLHLLIHSLYTHSDVFLRELISNASDALDKVRFRSLTDRDIADPNAPLEIDIQVNTSAKTLTIRDSGIGMTRDEVNQNIGTIAHSGSAEFIKKLSAAKDQDEKAKLQLIGQFGVGFYSVFMVAERVVLTTRSADPQAQAVLWESAGGGTYTLSAADRRERGTELKIYLRGDCEEYLDAHRLEQVIRRHSDYVGYPIKVAGKQVNSGSALWTRPRSQVTEEQYCEFYTHLSGDREKPLAYEHVAVDVPIQFYSVLYVPRQSPMELLFRPEPRIALDLYVKRVFIQDDCKELLPMYLRFVRGVVDCDDLPLNVSRENLQHNPVVVKIRANLVRRLLGLIENMAKNRPEDYLVFWRAYGIVLKEGIATDHEHHEQLSRLLRYPSSLGETPEALVSLQDYLDRMKEGQEQIYYLAGEQGAVAPSPLLDAFRQRGLEVLFLTDPVDEWVMTRLEKYEGKAFQAVDAEEVDLGKQTRIEGVEEDREQTIELISFLKKTLAERVADVRESQRLTDSPCALVTPKGGLSHNMERLMKMADREFAPARRVLEINPRHPVIRNLGAHLEKKRQGAQLEEWAHFLVDYVLLGEGTVEDPQRVVRNLQTIMGGASAHLAAEA
ncbi:MAG: molecular chaperone HtpG [Candidatus Latescibacteria bacterium]|nr:molecular chaperone HtpG [Candidatus Latescibacterota bacterium]